MAFMIRDRQLHTNLKTQPGMSASKRRRTRGNTMVELSLICIVFLTLLIGAFDFGQMLFIHQSMVERLRWAARMGVAQQDSNSQIQNLVIYGNTAGTGSAFFGLTTSMVTVTTSDLTTDNARTQVVIAGYPYKMITPYGSGSFTGPTITIDIARGMFD